MNAIEARKLSVTNRDRRPTKTSFGSQLRATLDVIDSAVGIATQDGLRRCSIELTSDEVNDELIFALEDEQYKIVAIYSPQVGQCNIVLKW